MQNDRQHRLNPTEKVFGSLGEDAGTSAPEYLVQPASFSSIASENISETITLVDLGEAFLESATPSRGVGTPVSYCSPELIFKRDASRWSDIWALSCTMFEIRSGSPLFGSFINSPSIVLREILRILGKFPESYTSSLKEHDIHSSQKDVCHDSWLGE